MGECGDDSERGVLWEGPRDPLGYDALGVEVEPESEELEELLVESCQQFLLVPQILQLFMQHK